MLKAAGCSELLPAGLWISPRMVTLKPLWTRYFGVPRATAAAASPSFRGSAPGVCSYAGLCHQLPRPLRDACVVGQGLLAPAVCWFWFVSVSSNGERDSIGRRRLEPAKLNSQFSEVEKWEVTKAGLLLPREEMLVAPTGCPALLRAAPHCWRPCPRADATAAQAESGTFNSFSSSSRFNA